MAQNTRDLTDKDLEAFSGLNLQNAYDAAELSHLSSVCRRHKRYFGGLSSRYARAEKMFSAGQAFQEERNAAALRNVKTGKHPLTGNSAAFKELGLFSEVPEDFDKWGFWCDDGGLDATVFPRLFCGWRLAAYILGKRIAVQISEKPAVCRVHNCFLFWKLVSEGVAYESFGGCVEVKTCSGEFISVQASRLFFKRLTRRCK